MRKQKMKKPDLEIKARELLDTFFNLVKEYAVIEKEPKILGNFYFMFLKGKKIVKN
jgi:translation initiation factor IF-3